MFSESKELMLFKMKRYLKSILDGYSVHEDSKERFMKTLSESLVPRGVSKYWTFYDPLKFEITQETDIVIKPQELCCDPVN